MKSFLVRLICVFAMLLVFCSTTAAQDVVEFLSGARVEGKVSQIDKEARQVNFEAMIGGRPFSRVYAYSQIHAVTYRGQRYVINEMGEKPAPRPRPTGGTDSPSNEEAGSATTGGSYGRGGVSKAEIDALVRQAGTTPPDWYDSEPLDFPKSLDLSWPEKPPGGWNNQVNIGQYIWDVINPNENRWRSGIRFMHYLLALHKDDPALRNRVMMSLADMYFRLFQDYPRAVYWWQQAGMQPGDNQGVFMAESLYKLGSKQLATAWLYDPDRRGSGPTRLQLGMIKLWGEMGETDKALKLADVYVKAGGEPHAAYFTAGDALRTAGRYMEAVKYYQQCINTPVGSNKQGQRFIDRAKLNLQAVQLFELSDVRNVADGTYTASSRGYEDQVHVEVRVYGGQIESVRVTQHREKQYYSAIQDVPAQILEKQGVKGVDATSKATITGEAILNSTAKALASGKKN